MAASAIFALKAGVWFRRGRLVIVSPDSLGTACPLSGRNSTYRPVQISGASSEVAALGLVLQPGSIAVFWPSAGVSSGVLIVLGARGRWPAVAGIAIAQICVGLTAPQEFWHIPWVIAAITLCDTVEPLIIPGLIARYFGPDFALDRMRNVVGLLAAAVIGALP
jgi:integral membrane sensor domain MASE1